ISIRTDDDIVGTVQVFALVVEGDDLPQPVRPDPDQGARHLLAYQQAAVGLVRHAVALVRRPRDQLHAPLLAPAPSLVAGDVAEYEVVARRVPGGPFGEDETRAEQPEVLVAVDELVQRVGGLSEREHR